jgi:hypothetical protein
MTHPYQPDHETIMLDELLAWFRTKPKLRALVEGIADQVQELEESFRELREERLLSAATGAQLDQYGRVVGEQRGALSDADFAKFIEARILTNTSEGDVDRLLAILRIIAGPLTAGTDVEYTPLYAAAFQMSVIRDVPLTATMAARIVAQMLDVTPAGVGVEIIEGPGADTFRFDVGPGFDVGKLAWILP